MGIFSDKCEKCGSRVKKRARFCSKCGEPAPGAWIKCFKCGKWVGAESAFCPHCKAALRSDERELIENGVVQLNPGVFIQRVDVDTLRTRLGKHPELIIEHGTSAILMVEGEIKEVLQPGTYKADGGIFKRFFWGQPPTSLFLVKSGEVIFPYSATKFRSKEDMELNVYAEIIVQFDPKYAGMLIANVMSGKRQLKNELDTRPDISASESPSSSDGTVGYSDFRDYFKVAFHHGMKDLCNTTSIDDLVRNADIRFNFEQKLRKEFEAVGIHSGMRLVRVSAVDFYGKDYEELRGMAGELETETRRQTLEKRARQVLLEGNKDKLSSEQELKLYIDRLAFEYSVESETQAKNLDALRMDLAHELNLKASQQDHELKSGESEFRRQKEALDNAFNINETIKYNDFVREQDMKDHEAELEKTADWMKIKKAKRNDKVEYHQNLLATYAKYSDTELAAVLPPDQVDLILKARKLEHSAKLEQTLTNLTPEQILAMKAGDSPEAAKALAELSKAKAQVDMKKSELESGVNVANAKAEMAEKANGQAERILDKSLDANARTAGQTYIKNK